MLKAVWLQENDISIISACVGRGKFKFGSINDPILLYRIAKYEAIRSKIDGAAVLRFLSMLE